ncbi:MAG TPA: alpha-amylase family glycosyl hydrolase [Thermoanaerobaculia bacterium]|nr:alpha-amylase family glycosyl hydrolase [Thermoanaerobaculia bacterium]
MAGDPAATPETTGSPAAARVSVTPHERWDDAILYFVILDRFADGDPRNNANVDRRAKGTFHGGDLAGLTQQLDEIADLGATAIWITPVVDNMDGFVTGAGFPDWAYHGYWADDFTRVDPRFGTEAELKRLVDEAHARGIEVLLDVVYNHAGYESAYLKNPATRSWLRIESQGSCGKDDITTCVSGLPDFRTEEPQVADHLLEAHISMAERVGLDGFRLDTVKHVTHGFWQEHRRRVNQRLGEDFFLIGEVWGGDAKSLDPWFAGDEMDAGFDFSFQGNVISFLQGRGRTVAFDRYLLSRDKVREGYLLSPYLSSHDVPGALMQLEGNTELFRLAALLQLTASGLPTIYYGEEVARPGGDWPDNRSDMPWGDRKVLPGAGLPRDEKLRADYKKLIAIRRAHKALSRGDHQSVSSEGDLLVFARLYTGEGAESGDAVVVAVNRGAVPATASFDAPAEWGDGPVRDLWNGSDVTRTGGKIEITVAPREARILAVQR